MKFSKITAARALAIAVAKMALMPTSAHAHEPAMPANLPLPATRSFSGVGGPMTGFAATNFAAQAQMQHAHAAMSNFNSTLPQSFTQHNFVPSAFVQHLPQQNFTAQSAFQTPVALSSTVKINSTTSGARSLTALPTGAVTIIEQGMQKIVLPSSSLTVGESLAVSEIQANGHQSVRLDAGGNIIGGYFIIPSNFSLGSSETLTIPKGARAIDQSTNLLTSGNIVNDGTLIIANSTRTPTTLDATNIANAGAIRSLVPLTLSAGDSLTNAGQIKGQSDLNINAPNVVNSGLIASINGNINLATTQPANIAVTNTGGTIQAANGNVNVRNSNFSGSNDFTLTGGNVLAQNINVNSGCGAVNINADNIAGQLNVTAGSVHSYTNSPNLQLGNMTISGDPTFFNVGSIQINGDITSPGAGVAIIATRDITASSAVTISTAGNNSSSLDVLLAAGANFTTSPSGASTGPTASGAGDISTTVTVTGASGTGGKIDFGSNKVSILAQSVNTTANADAGGNVTLLAFAGTSSGSGSINASKTSIFAAGNPGTTNNEPLNGNVVIAAGATSGTAIAIGQINTNPQVLPSGYTQPGGTTLGVGGGVTLINANPQVTSSIQILNGNIQNSSNGLSFGPVQQGNILVNGNISTAMSPITIATGGSVALAGALTTSGSQNLPTRAPGNVSILAGGNIVDLSGASINTSPTSNVAGNYPQSYAGDINLVAGGAVAFYGTPTLTLANGGISESFDFPLTVSGPSSGGGNINFTSITAINASGNANAGQPGSAGGNINIVALGAASGKLAGGNITLPATLTLMTAASYSAGNAAANGDVNILAGAPSGNSINMGNVTTYGGADSNTSASVGGGNITIATSQALSGLPFTYDVSNTTANVGTAAAGGSFVAGKILPASAIIGNLTAAGGSYAVNPTPLTTTIAVTTGGDLTIGSVSNSNNTLYYKDSASQIILVDLSSSTINLKAGGQMTITGGSTISSDAGFVQGAGIGTSGGVIVLSAKKFNITQDALGNYSPVTISANGINGYDSTATDQTGGNGGSISITTTGTGLSASVNIGDPLGVSPGYFTVSATGDTASGNGGVLTVNSGGNINISTSALTMGPQAGANNMPTPQGSGNPVVASGTGAQITLIAANKDSGAGQSGLVYISKGLDASGAASTGNVSGNGGSITIVTNSAQPFNIGGASTSTHNGVGNSGILSANGNNTSGGTAGFGSGGTVSVTNLNGDIDIVSGGLTVGASNASAVYSGGNGGNIILTANGNVLSQGSLDASGGQNSATLLPGSGGRIEISTNSKSTFEVGTPTAVQTNGVIGTLKANGSSESAPTLSGSASNLYKYPIGNGGSIILSNLAGNIQIDTHTDSANNTVANISVTAFGANASIPTLGGDGGTIRLYAPTGAVFVGASLDVSGGAPAGTSPYITGGNGGTIEITSNSATALGVGVGTVTNGVNGTLTANGFSGGSILLTNLGKGGIAVASQSLSAATDDVSAILVSQVNFGGNGGNISLQAPKGPVLVTGTLDVSGMSGASVGANGANYAGNGGNIFITTNTTTPFIVGYSTGTTPVSGVQNALIANGGQGNAGNGNGGSVTIVNNGTGGITVNAPSSTNPNVPTISVIAFDNGVNSNLSEAPGNGGTINLEAPKGPVQINTTLNVNASAPPFVPADPAKNIPATQMSSGLGGTILIIANNGTQPLALGVGELSATGWNGGTITVINTGTGGITVAAKAINVAASDFNPLDTQFRLAGGTGGNISLQAPNGPVAVAGRLSVDGGNGTAVANIITESGGTISGPGGTGDPVNITGLTTTSSTLLDKGQIVLISGTINNGVDTVQEYQSLTVAQTSSSAIEVNQLLNSYDAGSVSIAAAYQGGNGGQISILTKSSTPFAIGTTTKLSANGGLTGGNGGIISVTNVGKGGITVTNQATELTVAPADGNAFFAGGNGGTINLKATGLNASVLVTGGLNVNGGAESQSGNYDNYGGNGGSIAIVSNTTGATRAFNIGSPTTNGVSGTLQASGLSGGSIGVSNLGTGGITFDPTQILVTASGSMDKHGVVNGGNISLTAAAKGAIISVSTAGTLAADSGPSGNDAGNGGTIALTASVIQPTGGLTLSAQSLADNGAAGTITVTQTTTTGTALVLGTSGITISLSGNGGNGHIIVSSANGINITDSLSTATGSTGDGTINLTTAGKASISGAGAITSDSLQLTGATGALGTATVPLSTFVGTLSYTSAGGSVYVNNTGALHLNGSSNLLGTATGTAGAVSITSDNDIFVDGPQSTSGAITLSSGGTISVNANVVGRAGIALDAWQQGGNSMGTITSPSGVYLMAQKNGVSLIAGSGGAQANTATNLVNLNVTGDGMATPVAIINTGNLQLNVQTSTGIATFSVNNNLGSIVTKGTIDANVISIDNSTAKGTDAYSITLGGPVGSASTTNLTLKAAGDILQSAAANVVTASAITLSSQTGNIGLVAPGGPTSTPPAGSTYQPFAINLGSAGGTLSVNVFGDVGSTTASAPLSGQVNIANSGSGTVNLQGVLTAGDFQLTSAGNITVVTGTAINSTSGGVYLHNTSNATGNIAVNGNMTGGGGPVIIENDNQAGTITTANNVSLSGYGRVWDYQASPGLQYTSGVILTSGAVPTTATVVALPTNVTLTVNGKQATSVPSSGTTAYFGNLTTTTPAAVNLNTPDGSAYDTTVVFNGANSGSIVLGTNTTVTSNGTVQALSSLDLSKTTVISHLTSLTSLKNSGIVLTGKNLSIANSVNLSNLGAFNIASGYTVTLTNFQAANPVAVNIANTTSKAAIAGTLVFDSSAANLSQGNLFVSAVNGKNDAVFSITGSVVSDGNIGINTNGKFALSAAGSLTAASTGTIAIASGASNTGLSTGATAPGTITLGGKIKAGESFESGSITVDSSGSVLQPTGSLKAGSVTIQFGGGGVSTQNSQVSLTAVTAQDLTITGGTAAPSLANASTILVKEAATAIISNLNFNVLSSALYVAPSATLNVSGQSQGTVSVVSKQAITVGGDLSADTINLTTTGALNIDGSTVSVANPGGRLTIAAGNLDMQNATLAPQAGQTSITASGAINLTGSTIIIGNTDPNYYAGNLAPADIISSGTLSLTAKTGGLTIDSGSLLQVVGGNLFLTASKGDVSLSGQFTSLGGNISVVAEGNIYGTSPVFTASAVGTTATNTVGGGIFLTSGSKNGLLPFATAQIPGTVYAIPTSMQPDGTVQPLGRQTLINNTIGFNVPTGAIIQSPINTGTVDLSTTAGMSPTATLTPPQTGQAPGVINITGGTMYFNASGSSGIRFNGSTFNSNSFELISYEASAPIVGASIDVADDFGGEHMQLAHLFSEKGTTVLSSHGFEALNEKEQGHAPKNQSRKAPAMVRWNAGRQMIHALQDMNIITPVAVIQVKKGATFLLALDNYGLRVTGCSLPGEVSLLTKASPRPINMMIGQELLISADQRSMDDLMAEDGMPRRNFRSRSLGEGLHMATCDVSMYGLLSRSDLMKPLRQQSSQTHKKVANNLIKLMTIHESLTRANGQYEVKATSSTETTTPSSPSVLAVEASL